MNTAPFRVQIFGLPFERITQPIAHFIENVLGRTAEVDGNTGVLWGRYLRVRVQLDLSLMLVGILGIGSVRRGMSHFWWSELGALIQEREYDVPVDDPQRLPLAVNQQQHS